MLQPLNVMDFPVEGLETTHSSSIGRTGYSGFFGGNLIKVGGE